MSEHDSPIILLEKIFELQEKTGDFDRNKHHRRFSIKDIPSLDRDDDEIEDISNEEASKAVIVSYEKNVRRAVDKFSRNPDLRMFKLGAADVKMLAYVYNKVTSNYENDFYFEHLMTSSGKSMQPLFEQIDYFRSLEERSIFFRSRRTTTYRYSISSVIETRGVLSEFIMNCLMGRNCRQNLLNQISEDQLSSDSPIEAIYNYYVAFTELSPEMCDRYFDDDPNYMGFTINHYLDLLWQQINLMDAQTPLRRVIVDYKLGKHYFFILMLIYCFKRQQGTDLSTVRLSNWLSSNQREFDQTKKYLQEECGLIRSGLILAANNHGDNNRTLRLNGRLVAEFTKLSQRDRNKSNCILEDQSDMLSLINPKQNLRDLILAEAELKVINTVIRRLKNPQEYDLSKWGLTSPSLSLETASLNSCIMLLYGYPGTGKTLTAGVIANELGRQLVKIEASSLRNCYYGATEENVRQLFFKMRQLVVDINPAPVFLLNEADQLIHKRIKNYNSSVTATENTIQAIFLEEMETFPGILIFTTNLEENLDEAMSRRFNFRIELKKPDLICAEKLWRLHLPNSIPGAAEIDTYSLAEKYCFTGGQIRIVVQNACFEAMLRGSGSVLCTKDIEIYAERENPGNGSALRTIGF